MDERIRVSLMNLNINLLKNKFGKNLILNENLSRYSWFNLGGPANIFFRPESKKQLIEFLNEIKNLNFKIDILGAGSNTLIRDRGVNGVVIKLSSKFSNLKLLKKDTIEVGASTLDKKVSEYAKDNSIGNLEFLSCIPGSIGGAIMMNSGCYDSDISKILVSVKVVDFEGNELDIKKENISFFYRGSNISKNYIIISAVLKGKLLSKELVKEKINYLINKKKDSQPSKIKTGGSTFKNINGVKAWKLIKDSGCDKFSVGGAKISELHSNFFVNDGSAKASDVEKLIEKVRKEVQLKTGVNLELELKIIGDEI